MLCRRQIALIFRRLSHLQNELVTITQETPDKIQTIDTRNLPSDDFVDMKFEQKSVLEDCDEDISHVGSYLKPAFNFAAFVNKSETLQELVKLGVALHKLEKLKDVPKYILGLDFEKDIKKHVIFLSDVGVPNEMIGQYITKNPFIFREDLDNLAVRVNYLKSKKFSDKMIASIVSRNPTWLQFSTQKIDDRLGFFQNEFQLNGQEVRSLATKQPKIITYSMYKLKVNIFSIREEMGFIPEEVKSILLKKPNVFIRRQENLLKTFEYLHKIMHIPIERIAEQPEVLICREFRLKQRHLFLEQLGKVQYNPRKPNYISLLSLVSGTDADFCTDIAKSTTQTFNTFLKSL